MKASKFLILCCLITFSLFVVACDGGGGGSSDSGTVAMSVTDAKPLLPENVTNLFVTFSEAWVHKSGGGWVELDLVESPYTIDLLQFQDGNTTELVPPAELDTGKYTQVRIVVTEATLRFDDGITTHDRIVEIASDNLKTDKNFTVDLNEDSAVDIVIHFDLSMSVEVSGSDADPTYKLKPVLHLFDDPLAAATIEGSINFDFFGDSATATVEVIADINGEVFTKVEIPKQEETEGPTEFSIYWLVPGQEYTVKIDVNQDDEIECEKIVRYNDPDADAEPPLPGEAADIGSCGFTE